MLSRRRFQELLAAAEYTAASHALLSPTLMADFAAATPRLRAAFAADFARFAPQCHFYYARFSPIPPTATGYRGRQPLAVSYMTDLPELVFVPPSRPLSLPPQPVYFAQ